jgi:multicomponent Na+:H+ antiporter subunit E
MFVWLVLSGQFDAFHLIAGALCVTAVTLTSGRGWLDYVTPPGKRLKEYWRCVGYSAWLIGQIVVANIYMLKLIFSPKIGNRISPRMVRFRTTLKSDLAKFILANSITLTPGTITVRIRDNEFLVHAISEELADAVPGDMEDRIARIFGEDA